jgi:hypothetical protein
MRNTVLNMAGNKIPIRPYERIRASCYSTCQAPHGSAGRPSAIAKRILAVFVRVVIHRMKKNKYNGEVSLCD